MLRELGVDPDRVLLVFNQRDRITDPALVAPDGLWISAATGLGIDDLKAAIAARLGSRRPAAAGGEDRDQPPPVAPRPSFG